MSIVVGSVSVQANGCEGVVGISGNGTAGSSIQVGVSSATGAASTLITTASGNDTIQISGSNMVVDAGAGTHSIFILGGGNDSFVLHDDGTDVINGFSLANKDSLDLRALLSEANLSLDGDTARLGAYVHVSNTNGTASVAFDPTGTWATPGSKIAVLENVGNTVTSLADLVSGGAVRIA